MSDQTTKKLKIAIVGTPKLSELFSIIEKFTTLSVDEIVESVGNKEKEDALMRKMIDNIKRESQP